MSADDLIIQCELVTSTAKSVVPHLKTYETVEEAVSIPCIVVQPGDPLVEEYHVVFGGKEAIYRFDIVLLVSRTNTRAAQREFYSLISASGVLFPALDALPGWDIDRVVNVGYYRVGQAQYWGGALSATYDG